ncbi:MAG TPA: protein translocase subunit SecF [Firmicutes bacterium]|nr:protein translocase subunit SecF [candidate division WOR-3 bacterium]HFD05171.1 protein translocase subunit SecF [Bacillota bacterium]
MLRIFKDTHIDFVGARRKAYIISGTLLLIGIISLIAHHGLNYGIDFTGGSLIQFHFNKSINTEEVRSVVADAGYGNAVIQRFGKSNDYAIKIINKTKAVEDTTGPEIVEAYVEPNPTNGESHIIVHVRAYDKKSIVSNIQYSLIPFNKAKEEDIISVQPSDMYDSELEDGVFSLRTLGMKQGEVKTIYLRAIDSNGNTGTSDSIQFKISATGQKTSIANIRSEIKKNINITKSNNEIKKSDGEILKAAFEKKYGAGIVRIDREDMVGPKISKELQFKAVWVVLLGILMMLIYVSFRFSFRFGVAAIIALFHDILITVGLISMFNIEVNTETIAALLTLIGYSINDSIVVSDRIRENIKKLRKENFVTIVNKGINETLSRTIITSFTTFIVLFVLSLIGGPVIRGFSNTLIFGVIIGTYSSIFVVAPIVVEWELAKPSRNLKIK